MSSAAAVLGAALGFPIAWLAARTTLPGRRLVSGAMWLVLLLPSWLPALGWERIVQPDGVMYRLGLDWPWVTHAIMGPFGVVLLLGLRCVPFSYLAITAALGGLGQEFEDAARVHGASRAQAMRLIIQILAREAAATTVYITHDQAEAFALADKVGVLERGRLVQAGTPEEIYTRPATPFVARFTGLAGELAVRVRERQADGTLLVEPLLAGIGRPGGSFLARPPLDHLAGPLLAGEGALMTIRPTRGQAVR